LAADIRKQMGHTIRQRKGDWRCYFFTDQVTFVLPAGELLIAVPFLQPNYLITPIFLLK